MKSNSKNMSINNSIVSTNNLFYSTNLQKFQQTTKFNCKFDVFV